jgi:hypothetical protein
LVAKVISTPSSDKAKRSAYLPALLLKTIEPKEHHQ